MAGPLSLARKVPWVRAFLVARWLYEHGRERVQQNLAPSERSRLWELMRRSKGRPANLTDSERDEFIRLVRQAARGPQN